jgi:hypothetical protein
VVGSSWLTLLFEILLLKQRFKLATPDLKAIVYPPPQRFTLELEKPSIAITI